MQTGKKEYYEQLHAYALGCLDKTDIVNLRSYIHSGEDYNWQELGEYQNLAALLPSILNMEVPEQQLKDKVARKLYRIRDEIRAKRSSDLSSLRTTGPNIAIPAPELWQQEELNMEDEPFIPEEAVEEHIDEMPFIEENVKEEQPEQKIVIPPKEAKEVRQNTPLKTREFEIVTSVRKTSEFFMPPKEQQIKEPAGKSIPPVQKLPEKEPEAKKEENIYIGNSSDINEIEPLHKHEVSEEERYWKDYSGKVPSSIRNPGRAKSSPLVNILMLVLIAVIGAGVYAYLNITSEVKTYRNEIENLNREIKNLSVKTEDTIELQKMLELPGTKVINLAGIQNNAFGKAIVNLNEGRGFLQYSGIPSIPEDKSYQLWIKASDGNFISLAVFRNISSASYLPFDIPEIPDQDSVNILLTEEPAAGSDKPGFIVLLIGTN